MCTTSSSASTTECWGWRKALSAQVRLFHWFVFAFTLVFTLLLLLSFYLFHLRLRRLRRHPPQQPTSPAAANPLSTAELGLKKELREMLPVIVFKESFSVSDTICSVCLGDYQAEDRLQQIPVCKHVFHVECIDHWLSTHTTCPLCRLSLLASSPTEPEVTNDTVPANSETGGNTSSLDDENCAHSPTNPELTQ